jgi:hypothetical protein
MINLAHSQSSVVSNFKLEDYGVCLILTQEIFYFILFFITKIISICFSNFFTTVNMTCCDLCIIKVMSVIDLGKSDIHQLQ